MNNNISQQLHSCKDYERNRLQQSALQLGTGTVLLVDERNMNVGTLNQNALKSVHALESVIKSQTLPIDFGYFNLDIPAEVSAIVISNAPSILNCNMVRIYLPSSQSIQLDPSTVVQIDRWSVGVLERNRVHESHFPLLRHWWCSCKVSGDVRLADSLSQTVEETFVQMRQIDSNFTEVTFHMWLVLSRLLTICEGLLCVEMRQWNEMKSLMEDLKRNVKRFT